MTPCDLRHTVTSLLAADGVPPETLADLLGHADTRMVWQHYRHRAGRAVDVVPATFGT